MYRFHKYICSLVVASAVPCAFATHNCVTKITSIDIQPNGRVAVSGNNLGASHGICSVVSTDGAINEETCKSIYSTLMMAFASGSNVRFYFNNDANTNCNKGDWGHLSSHGFYYLKVEK